jgi:hypothetical protein
MTPFDQLIVRSFAGPERVKPFQQTNFRFGSKAAIGLINANDRF